VILETTCFQFFVAATPHNEELHTVYSSSSIITMIKSRIMRLTGHLARIGRERERGGRERETAKQNLYRLSLGKPEGKRPRGSKRRKCLGLGERGWGGVDWTGLVQNRDQWRALVNSVTNLRVP
jgi:hypothetical protein